MATISGHSFNIGPYGKNVLKYSLLKPVSQFKPNMAWMSLSGKFSKLCPVTLTSIQDGHLQQTVLTLDPMRKKCFKISSETSKPI
jgi:hypothetical protein